jgi:hypothetical protein
MIEWNLLSSPAERNDFRYRKYIDVIRSNGLHLLQIHCPTYHYVNSKSTCNRNRYDDNRFGMLSFAITPRVLSKSGTLSDGVIGAMVGGAVAVVLIAVIGKVFYKLKVSRRFQEP